MKKGIILLSLLFVLLFMTNTSWAINYFVNAASGNDANSGRSTTLPWKTIQKAANSMASGDTCFVSPGSYPERINVSRSGAQGAPIVFKALGSGVVTKGFTVIANYVTVDGFEVTETSRTSWVDGTGFHIKGQYVKILNNYIHITYREGIRLGDDPSSSVTNNCLLQNNKIIRVGHSGILVCGVNNVVKGNEIAGVVQWAVTNPQNLDAVGLRFFGTGHIICNNYIHDIMLGDPENGNAPHVDAVQTWGPATYITIENNTFAMGEPTLNKQISMVTEVNAPVNDLTYRNNVCYNTLRGLNIYGSHVSGTSTPIENLKVENNTFDGFLDNPVEMHDCPNAKVMNNVFYNTKELFIDTKTASSGLQIGYNSFYHTDGTLPAGTHYQGDIWGSDPKFVSLSQRDYRLQTTSALIDKGVTLSDVTADLSGTARPQGLGFDMGAYETSSSSVVVSPTTDISSPKVIGASLTSSFRLTVTFSEKVSSAEALIKSNYSISGGISVKSISMNSTQDGVIISTSKHKRGVIYTVTVSNVKDLAGNVISSFDNKAQYQLAISKEADDAQAEDEETSPETYQLSQNFPNPFNPSTVIKYSVPENSFVTLKVYDMLGKEVATLVNEQKSRGNYEIQFDASKLSSGTYIYQMKTNNFIENKKMILEK
ncbi:MAG: T9SS type A sorting domain-containing protein [Ignavibacteria bacterium]|nr:T9SS type A sorting domain-containing protein [Ignavibacteria bacterium]MCU7515082.1 T9SS type A sorting domain-containing protein [Ignavibacteria bacterium]